MKEIGGYSISATSSGTLMTPKLVAMLIVGTPAGQLMVRLRRYRFLNTAGIALVIVGLFLLTWVTISSSLWTITVYLVIVGAGLGLLFPLSTAVVQAALSKNLMGAGTSMVQFWRFQPKKRHTNRVNWCGIFRNVSQNRIRNKKEFIILPVFRLCI